jgi:hypothetical protein
MYYGEMRGLMDKSGFMGLMDISGFRVLLGV